MADAYVPHGGGIVTLEQARAEGRRWYFTGRPCPAGHLSERSVSEMKCRECRRQREQARRDQDSESLNLRRRNARADDPERFRAVEKGYRERNPDKTRAKAAAQRQRHAKRISETYKEWRLRNADPLRKKKRADYESKREAYIELARKWREDNPDKCRNYGRSRRAREKNAVGSHTDDDVKRIYRLQKGRCAGCSVKLGDKYQIDHIVALTKGGSNFANNLQILCTTCNRSKSDKDPVVWAQDNGWLL